MAKYNEKELADTSKFLSFVLRHKPEAIGIVLDREGWADIDKLILCAQKAGKRLTRALLDTVVATSDKKRFSYSSDGRCIRAVQGHSTSQVAISFAEKTPPQFLYHGTASRFLDEIKKQGLIAGERHYVHLSADEATARKVGARHGSPVILTVKAQEMAKRGLPFWQAENGVWLTSTVAVEFLEGKGNTPHEVTTCSLNNCTVLISAAINNAAAPQRVAPASADVPLPSILVSAGPRICPMP